MNKIYDVAICGSGLAGLTLARQLKLKMFDLSIVLLDRLARPLPEAGFKVGESTVEVGAFYLSEVLQLTDYFEAHHFHKLGVRYFLGNGTSLFHQRAEIGLSGFHPPYSYQIDRGLLENDLRQFNEAEGIELLEGCLIKDIQLASEPEQLHQVIYTQGQDKKHLTLEARWIVDSTGRRRILQKKLNLCKPFETNFSAVWFRVAGRFDVDEFVPETETAWHGRVPHKIRYFSTNHLCGEGYWVWIIPLSTGFTSIGIVTNEDVHPFSSYHTYEKALQWLEKHEPAVAKQLRKQAPIDFMKLPEYTYSSKQVFSLDRWACAGVAGVFSDPLYSPGTDLIGFGNSLITQMVELDRQSQLTAKIVDEANRFLISHNESTTANIHSTYLCFGNETVMLMKYLWDVLSAWAFSAPLMYNSLFLDSHKRARVRQGTGQFFFLSHQMRQFFRDWITKSQRRGSFKFIDYLKIPFVSELRSRNLKTDKTEQELIEDHLASIERLEEFVQVVFRFALEDTMPEKLAEFPVDRWLNAWAISLSPERWEADGLFRPITQPRDLRPIMEQLEKEISFNARAISF